MSESPELGTVVVQDVLGVNFRVALASATGVYDATTTKTTMPVPAALSPTATLPSHGEQGHVGAADLFSFDENEVQSSHMSRMWTWSLTRLWVLRRITMPALSVVGLG